MVHMKHNAVIDCEPDMVFSAITTKKGIQGWWTVNTIIEPVVGSTAEFIFGDKYHNKMEIRDLIDNKRAEWYCLEGDNEWIGTDFIFNIERFNGKSLLRFGHNNWKGLTDFFAHCNFQWGRYMVSLKNYCEKGAGISFHPENKSG